MPILAIGGGHLVGRGKSTLESLQRFGSNVEGGVIAGCGHWIPKEKPEELLRHLLPFLEK
jgi:pimeloyl-ACP methyl ester carboxylesterase